ncbi:MAG TPA: molybdenum cofactor biosynthesis protein MoaE [Candidatus Polarisedimenticolia bacterium]|nr:molybdenum cofactor biosynthesis protein MoaE [Candidatus Polarisedimenticolia bacterium]
MRVRVLLFARLRELAGREVVDLDLPEGETLSGCWRRLQQEHPPLQAYRGMPLAAVNQEYAPANLALRGGEEVAFFPPVSGGREGEREAYRIIAEPILLDALMAACSGEDVGALASFVGTVRRENAGRRVTAVEYHAYPAMAEKVLRGIGQEMLRGYGPLRIALIHRVGRLAIGEASVAIVVGSAHRHAALGAVAYAIERIKQAAPIWKKEFYEDGSSWLEPAPAKPETP